MRGASLLAGGLLLLQAGAGTGLGRAVDQINASSHQPAPTVGPRTVVRPDTVWVRDRWLPAPGGGGTVLVPGHRERRISERRFWVPPLVTVDPFDGTIGVFPAAVKPPAAERQEP